MIFCNMLAYSLKTSYTDNEWNYNPLLVICSALRGTAQYLNGGFDMDCKFTTDLGLVTVNDDVLVRVAGYAALDCYGIVGMASKRSTDGIVQLMGKENLGRGVKIRTSGDKVDIDLFIIVEYGISISAVAASIIETVKYKVEHLTGIPVGRVNVCVEDIRV